MKTYIGIAAISHKENDPYDISSYEYCVVAENEERAREMIKDRINEYKEKKSVIKLEEVPINEGEQLRDVVSASYKGVIVERALEEALGFEAENEEAIKKESFGWVSTDLKHLLLNPVLFHSFITSELKKTCKILISEGQLRVYSFGGLTIDEERKEIKTELDLKRKKKSLQKEIIRIDRKLKLYL